jgi:hypothetical protein
VSPACWFLDSVPAAAQELDERRNAWLNPPGADENELRKRTLTNLYNERPAWLRMAHERLDAVVFAAYGWEAGMTDEELLTRLLALNLERAAAQGVTVVTTADEAGD